MRINVLVNSVITGVTIDMAFAGYAITGLVIVYRIKSLVITNKQVIPSNI